MAENSVPEPVEMPEDPVLKHVTDQYAFSMERFNEKYGRVPDHTPTIKEKCSKLKKSVASCTTKKVLHQIESWLPGIQVIRTYKFREYILGDIVSGLSVGIFSVPLSLGFALLASVPPILGLYTSLYPAFIYFIFGSSRHVAMGTMALSNLVIAKAVDSGTADIKRLMVEGDPENRTQEALKELLETEQISIAVSVTFFSGMVLLIMSFFQLGFIISYIGNPFMSGYLTGANIRVLTHQFIFCLGVKDRLGQHVGFLNYFYLVIDVFKNIAHTNVASVIMSLIAMAILLAVKYGINENKRVKPKLKIPVPIEMIVGVLGIIVCHFGKLNERYGVQVIGKVPQGIPAPIVPSMKHVFAYPIEGALCGIVSFVFSSMLVKLFCQRHNYPLNKNQELFASGMCNAVGPFLTCIAVSVSPPRAFLMEMTGGRTQVSYIINALFILLTLFALAPLLTSLPICILACLVITSCIPLFAHYIACIAYWKTNKYDFAIWFVTFLATLGINVDIGMVVGVGFSFIIAVYQSHRPYSTTLKYNTEDGILLDSKKYENVQSTQGINIFKYDSPLYFATLGSFKESIYAQTVNPIHMAAYKHHIEHNHKVIEKKAKKAAKKAAKGHGKDANASNDINMAEVTLRTQGADDVDNVEDNLDTPLHKSKEEVPHDAPFTDVHTIIVDCSAISFADTPGAQFFARFRKEYNKHGINFWLANVNEGVLVLMKRVPECEEVLADSIFPNVHSAVLLARQTHNKKMVDGEVKDL